MAHLSLVVPGKRRDYALKSVPRQFPQVGGMAMALPRVLLADDHTLVIEALRKLLESQFNIVGAVPDGLSLVQAAPVLKPDVVVVDIAMPLLSGLEAGRQVKRVMPAVKL